MPINIDMPKLSDTMTEGTLIKWHKKVGDTVEIGDILAEIETDKATMEMEAFDDGTITSILIQEGQKATIGSVLAILNGPTTAPAPAAVATPAAPAAPMLTPAAPQPAVATPAQPVATPAEPAPAPTVTAVTPPPPADDSSDRIKASPLARKLAEELRIDLATIVGTGPGGRIVKEDVDAAVSTKPAPAAIPAPSAEATAATALAAAIKTRTAPLAAAAVPAASPAPPPTPQAITPIISETDESTPLSTMRKIIASRLSTSKQTIPHFYLHLEVDAAPLTSLRKLVNDQTAQSHGNKYSLNDFILLAVINAAKTVPGINSSFAGDAIVRYGHIGLSVAIAVEDGLVTPVIKQAETKSLLTISREVKDLAARAKIRKLRPDEFDGGTLTVSNLGAWGVESFDAIINPPQAAILSIGAAVEKPVVKDGQVVPGLRMDIGLSCDHRVVDGAMGAQFLAEVKRLIEHPAMMLL